MSKETVSEYDRLGQRYVELWNGSDEVVRRETIKDLWVYGGEHKSKSIAVRGYEELEARVGRSNQRWVVEEGYRFRMRSIDGHHNVARIVWEMVDRLEHVESIGTDVLILDEAGKIIGAYQFIDQ